MGGKGAAGCGIKHPLPKCESHERGRRTQVYPAQAYDAQLAKHCLREYRNRLSVRRRFEPSFRAVTTTLLARELMRSGLASAPRRRQRYYI